MYFPATVDAYLGAIDEPQRALLVHVRATVHELCPEAVEVIAYGMPGFRLDGRLLLSYAGYKRHCAIYPASGAALEVLGEDLVPFLAQKATIRFTAQHPLPDEVLRRYVAVRVEEVRAAGGG